VAQLLSPSLWDLTLARLLEFVVGAAALVVVCRAVLEEDISWLAWALAAAAVVLLTVIRWPYGALSVLVGMSAMPVYFVEVFGWKARPEHFAGVIVSLAVGAWLLLHKCRMRLQKLDYWILAYLAINFASSAFGSPVPSATLRWALQNSLAVMSYFLVRMLIRDPETLRKGFSVLLAVGVIESGYGILCYASNLVFGTTNGMSVGQYLYDVAAPYGSLYEPNLFGAYAACNAVACLALYLSGGRRLRYALLSLICSLAAVLSYSRAALIAMVVSMGWLFWRSRGFGNWNYRRVSALVLAAGLILSIAVSAIGGVLQERFLGLYDKGLAEDTTITRLVVFQEALREIPNHPLLGSGTASFNLSFDWGGFVPEWAGSATWIANAPLRILHDTGILGLVTILAFLGSVWWKTLSGLRRSNTQLPILLGLAAGALIYCISFQSTDGSILAFLWVHLGFLATAAILITGSDESENGSEPAVQVQI
jgi:O-antigen ligase